MDLHLITAYIIYAIWLENATISFVLVYLQLYIETSLYMLIPLGAKFQGRSRDNYILKLKQNLYGQKQAEWFWHQHLHSRLMKLGFIQSKQNKCIYFKNDFVIMIYVDNCIAATTLTQAINQFICKLNLQGFDLTNKGEIKDYLGVNIT